MSRRCLTHNKRTNSRKTSRRDFVSPFSSSDPKTALKLIQNSVLEIALSREARSAEKNST